MANATSSRYQSRLFNFVHQQSRRLGDRVEQTFRHLQVATTWSLEALLYPVFLLVQKAVESAGRQLNPQQAQKKLHLSAYNPDSPPATDTPIQRILQAVENLPQTTEDTGNINKNPLGFLSGKRLDNAFSRFKFVQNSSSTDLAYSSPIREKPSSGNIKQLRLPIRGIATELINRNLVLVTVENQILDILTPQQQEKLQDRIIGEVADYWHYWRLAAVKKETEILPEIDRLLTKLTSVNDVSIAVLPASERELVYPQVLTFIDTSIAKLESNALIPLSRANLTVQQRSREIIEVVQTKLNIFIYGKELTTTNKEIKSDRFQIQAIIEAALNYFFGQPKGKKLDSSPSYSPSTPALPISRQLPNQDLTADPWLSWGDLFGEFKEVADQEVANEIKNPALRASESPRYSPKIYNYQNIAKKPGSVVKQQKPTTDLKRTQKTSKKAQISQLGNNKGEIAQKQHFQTTEIEAQPDWIETKATSIGYEKHPLEQILAWLDAALLWLEEMFVRLFKSLQQFWVRK